MPSLRSKFWSIIISRLIMKAGEINGPDDIRRDMSGDKISFLRDNWKKEKYIDYINDFIGSLEILKLNNKKVTSNKTLLYLHGGGYVACGPETHGALITQLSLITNSHVVFPIYRLAPENPFPAAIEDALASYKNLLEVGINANEIFIAGDSAGGGLTLALLQKIKSEELPMPSCAIVISPWTDLTLSGNSIQERGHRDPMIKPGPNMQVTVDAYCGDEDPSNPLISPLFAEYFDMPPIQIQVASEETIYDDSSRLHKKLKEQNSGKVEFIEWKGLFHVFQAFCSGWLAIPEAKKSIKEIAKFTEKYIN